MWQVWPETLACRKSAGRKGSPSPEPTAMRIWLSSRGCMRAGRAPRLARSSAAPRTGQAMEHKIRRIMAGGKLWVENRFTYMERMVVVGRILVKREQIDHCEVFKVMKLVSAAAISNQRGVHHGLATHEEEMFRFIAIDDLRYTQLII